MRVVLGVTGIAAMLIAGCTAGGGAEPRSDMGPAETQAAGQAITHASHSDARDFRLAGDGGTAFAGGCTSSIPLNPADADGDGIPDVPTVVTYSGCIEGGMTFSGTQTIEDEDTSTAGFEFTSAWDIDATGSVAGSTVSYSYAAVITATGGTSGVFTISDTADIDTTISGPDFDGTVEDSHVWTVAYAPDDGVWSPTPGLPLEDGDLTLSGPWDSVIDPDGGAALEVSGLMSTTVTLRTDDTCASSIVSGEVEVLVGEPEQGTLTVTWTSCGQTSVDFSALAF